MTDHVDLRGEDPADERPVEDVFLPEAGRDPAEVLVAPTGHGVGGADVHVATGPSGEEVWSIEDESGWWPGVYASEHAARYSHRLLTRDQAESLADRLCDILQEDRLVTVNDVTLTRMGAMLRW